MAPESSQVPGLGPGERVLGVWPAQAVQGGEASLRRGRLVLTTHRCSFLRRARLLSGNRWEKDPVFTTRLEDLTSAHPRQFHLRIGYGDRIEIGGLEIGGCEFQLDRGTDPLEILAEIAKARAGRIAELGRLVSGGAQGKWEP